jgi:hypothetical protein
MNRQEILQLKAMALQAAAGNLAQGKSIYDWFREKTDDNGDPAVARVQTLMVVPTEEKPLDAVNPDA